jgi:hypothetical protein
VVLENVLARIDSENLAVHVVWTPVLKADDYESAKKAPPLLDDPRTSHYWDGDQSLGLAYGHLLELPRGRELAWDIYFAYAAGVTWGDTVPAPSDWVHQLGRDERHLGDGSGLRKAVESLLEKLDAKEGKAVSGLIGGS